MGPSARQAVPGDNGREHLSRVRGRGAADGMPLGPREHLPARRGLLAPGRDLRRAGGILPTSRRDHAGSACEPQRRTEANPASCGLGSRVRGLRALASGPPDLRMLGSAVAIGEPRLFRLSPRLRRAMRSGRRTVKLVSNQLSSPGCGAANSVSGNREAAAIPAFGDNGFLGERISPLARTSSLAGRRSLPMARPLGETRDGASALDEAGSALPPNTRRLPRRRSGQWPKPPQDRAALQG